MSLRVSWFSNAPWGATGYGNQTKLFVPRIKALGHEISVSAFWGLQGSMQNWNGINVYPIGKHPYGQDVIEAHARDFNADIIISLLDLWVVQPENIQTPWFPWFPIDHEPIPSNVLSVARRANKCITMSKFGQTMANNVNLENFYIPHGVDTKVFKPYDRELARKYIGLPQDAFVVGMVAANKGMPPRKAFYEQIAAFKVLKSKHEDALLFLHTDDGTHGGESVDLTKYCEKIGLKPQKDVVFVDQYFYMLGLNDEYMVNMYNSFDVMMNVSLGEGFGIPIVEAQACGCPVIVGDWTSMGELCFSGWKIYKNEAFPEYHNIFDAFQFHPTTESIAERLYSAYDMRDNPDYKERARHGALQYDADRITEKYWKPTLETIENTIKELTSPKLELVKF